MKLLSKRRVMVLILLGLFGTAVVWYFQRGTGQAVSFRTAAMEHGDLLVSISATGTVEPLEVVDVGAQVAGRILSFGMDADGKLVDYGSEVHEGTVLARIDDSLYAADEAQAEALLQSAKAGVQVAKADLEQLKAKLHQAERDWRRAQKLGPSDALAQSSYDAYQSAYETAKANVIVGEAAILQAQASVAQARASLRRAQRNLEYCTITSPVKGVIIDRRVNIGQTVVASLNAPSLFLIAKDLTRMQVWVAVNEADISKIHPGQPVTFTVDAFPGETFLGEVGKVRLNASMTQNVVTYTVEIMTDNSNGRLLPYLTANVRFELNRRHDVLLAPNAALRWQPSVDQIVPKFLEAFENPGAQQSAERNQRRASRSPTAPAETESTGVIWVIEGQQARPLRVRTGLTDGSVTEVEGEDLKDGMQVVVGRQSQATGQSDTGSPFTPKFRRSKGSSSK